ncbi:MAG: hypothetical protein E7541_00065 [Ruminococcaceae bacterium]|nr:hypothetical protein [Oscillospiraceae bacterium]
MNTIRLKEVGIVPGADITLSLAALMKEHKKDTTFVFENADYFFKPHPEMQVDYRISNSDVYPVRTLGLWLKEMENCALLGNGARLWFEGHMQPFTLDSCSDVKVENFTINWKKPMVAEGIVTGFSDTYVDMYIDPTAFPHRLTDGKLEFDIGADEWYPICPAIIIYEPHSRKVRRATGDCFFPMATKELGNNIYRMERSKDFPLAVGDILVLRHNYRRHAGIFSERCRDLTFENITVHSCGGLGCLAQFCHNLTFRGMHFVPDRAAGRLVTNGRDDGMHITCNSGTVTITESTFLGLMDDPINVHGCCVTSDEVVNSTELRCKYRHKQAMGFRYWAKPGDEIAFIERGSMHRIHTATVAEYDLEQIDTFRLSFTAPLPDEVLELAKKGDALALDNLTNTAAFVCTKNRFGSCRARGILVSTPKPVLIADNYFESSGSAILVAGDSNYWFESGECNDVEIRNNVFTDACLTSDYQFCEGVISLCPIVPQPDNAKPYHKHVRIHHNTFDVADTPALYAYATTDLRFTDNRIFRSPSAERWHAAEGYIRLKNCTATTIKDNEWIGNFTQSIAPVTEACEDITVQ